MACTKPALITKAASELNCAKEGISTENIAPYVERVDACGRSIVYARMSNGWQSPLERAAFDMDCPRDELETRYLGGTTVGVVGCGKRMTYVLAAGGWVANTEQQGAKDGQ